MSLLQNLARYVFRTGNGFAPNHHIDANGPISLEEDDTQTALGFIEDPDLGSIGTPAVPCSSFSSSADGRGPR